MLRLEEHISSSKPEDTLLLVIGHIFTHMLQLFRLRRPSGGPPGAPAGGRNTARGVCCAADADALINALLPTDASLGVCTLCCREKQLLYLYY